jgi:hypothetical protein
LTLARAPTARAPTVSLRPCGTSGWSPARRTVESQDMVAEVGATELECQHNRRELAAVVHARQKRDRAQAAAKTAAAQWRGAIRAARAADVPEAEIARAAGTTAAEVRRLSSTR